jgi:hypothetical protein
MRTQFYAIGLDVDQRPEFNGLMARQHGRKSDMEGYVGQYVGANSRFYSAGDYEIGEASRQKFADDRGAPIDGAIYSLAEL